MSPSSSFSSSEPRPDKALSRTAWMLLGLMIVGGVLIFKAYGKHAEKQDKEHRPAIIHRIEEARSLRVVCQDGKIADLSSLQGRVVVVQRLALGAPESCPNSLAAMQTLAKNFADRPDFAMVSLAIGSVPADQAAAKLAQTSSALGMRLPQWWLCTTESKNLCAFIKNELKTSIFPHQNSDGGWLFDPAIVLIDRHGQLRRAVVPQKKGGPPYIAAFDFEQAAQWDKQGIKTGTEFSNREELEKLLRETIEELLGER